MKVLSLIQPWASLIYFNEKRIETRSWKTNYRGELYIHASKNTPAFAKRIFHTSWFRKVLMSHGVEYIEQLPLGQIIAKCNLVDCKQIVLESPMLRTAKLQDQVTISGNEYLFGDYTPCRYAWILEDIQPLDKFISASGKLNIWNFEIVGSHPRDFSHE